MQTGTCQTKTLSFQLTSCADGDRSFVQHVWWNRSLVSPSANLAIGGSLQQLLSQWWCVWLPVVHMWFVFQSSRAVSGAASTEGFKSKSTDPHKQALSFMASVTPSLLESDSQNSNTAEGPRLLLPHISPHLEMFLHPAIIIYCSP